MDEFMVFMNETMSTYSIILNQAGFQLCEQGYAFGPAIRDYYLFHYIAAGEGIFRCAGHETIVKKGQIFIIYPGEITFYQADNQNPWIYYWFAISGCDAGKAAEKMGFTEDVRVIDYTLKEDLKEHIKKLSSMRIEHESDHLLEISKTFELIALLIKNNENLSVYPHKTESQNHYLKMATDYIYKNYTKRININEIADYIGIDRTQLFRLFKEAYGQGPQAFLINYRMKKAWELLTTTQLSIKVVAYSVGYADAYQFSKIFKKVYGSPPKQIRE